MSQTTSPVRATLNYSVDNGIPPDYYFYEPGPEVKLNPPGTDPHEVEIHDAWPLVDRLSADREGFELKPFLADAGAGAVAGAARQASAGRASRFDQFDDDEAVHRSFYPQVVDFVKRHTGAQRVVVFDHTIRKRLPADLKQQTTVQRPAVLLVHSDYTVASGPQRVRDIVPADAEALLQRRVAFYNVWKPLYRRVEELPLAMCDASTHAEGDMLRMDLKYRERTGEIYVMRHSPAHRWYYFPLMEADQALLLKTYESELDGRARFMGHTAFEDPSTPPDAPRRESIEVRTMAFF